MAAFRESPMTAKGAQPSAAPPTSGLPVGASRMTLIGGMYDGNALKRRRSPKVGADL